MDIRAAASKHDSISTVIAAEKGLIDDVYGPKFSVEVFFRTAEEADAFRAAVIDTAPASSFQSAEQTANGEKAELPAAARVTDEVIPVAEAASKAGA